jgi:hypothetical protein
VVVVVVVALDGTVLFENVVNNNNKSVRQFVN